MLREIIIPAQNAYTLHLPDEYIGKTVEVIAFEVEVKKSDATTVSKNDLEDALKFYDSIHIDISAHKFNRDEANER